jgi:hypothetical protein
MAADVGTLTASQEQHTRAGISALEQADIGVSVCKQDVARMAMDLRSHYQGADGGKFYELVRLWGVQADLILEGLREMRDALHQTLGEQRKHQAAMTDRIDSETSKSDAVYQALRS